jgi:hypothetical protein
MTTMSFTKRLFLAILVLQSWTTVCAASDLTIVSSSIDSTINNDHRELQIINTICNAVSTILPGDLLCNCAITVGFVFVCSFQSPFCLGPDQTGYCSVPTIQGDIRLLRRTIAFQFCLLDATNGGNAVPGVCIDIGGVLNEDDASSFFGASSSSTSTKESSSVVTKVKSVFQSIRNRNRKNTTPSTTTTSTGSSSSSQLLDCTATSEDGKTKCNSCQLCNDNTGYVFDCTNINPILVQSTCTPLNIITNVIRQGSNNSNITFFPHFDFQK